jgi:hypothetical protein
MCEQSMDQSARLSAKSRGLLARSHEILARLKLDMHQSLRGRS